MRATHFANPAAAPAFAQAHTRQDGGGGSGTTVRHMPGNGSSAAAAGPDGAGDGVGGTTAGGGGGGASAGGHGGEAGEDGSSDVIGESLFELLQRSRAKLETAMRRSRAMAGRTGPGAVQATGHHTPHTGSVTAWAAKEYGHEVAYTPPYHSDLQPIERVWGIAKNEVARQNNLQTTMADVLHRLKTALEGISPKTIYGASRRRTSAKTSSGKTNHPTRPSGAAAPDATAAAAAARAAAAAAGPAYTYSDDEDAADREDNADLAAAIAAHGAAVGVRALFATQGGGGAGAGAGARAATAATAAAMR